jgi:hypothetical protein
VIKKSIYGFVTVFSQSVSLKPNLKKSEAATFFDAFITNFRSGNNKNLIAGVLNLHQN